MGIHHHFYGFSWQFPVLYTGLFEAPKTILALRTKKPLMTQSGLSQPKLWTGQRQVGSMRDELAKVEICLIYKPFQT